MADEKQVVNLAVEPTPQIDRTPADTAVETPAEQPQQIETTPEATIQTPPPAVQPAQADVDEFGVPYKNRYMEQRRKNEELVEKLPQIIEEKLSKVTQPQQPTYTYEQLEVYKQQNQQDANIVAWVVGEQRKIQLAEQRKIVEEVTGQQNRQREFDLVRQRAFEEVRAKRPEALDQNHPMFNFVKSYMQVPDIGNRADGLMIAAKLAYADYMDSQAPVLKQKVEQAKADIKQAQKASLTEGAGRKITVSSTPQQAALESLRKTGSIKDAEAAVGAILRNRGFLE